MNKHLPDNDHLSYPCSHRFLDEAGDLNFFGKGRAPILAHLLVDHYPLNHKLILNIAHRSKCTTHKNLETGLIKTGMLVAQKYPENIKDCRMVFNVQYPTTEPIINLADYFLWAIQRKWERNENRFFDYISSKIKSIRELYK